MKIPFYCFQCLEEGDLISTRHGRIFVRDDGLYKMECINGHKSVSITQNPKFEILFEIGANAIVDGYFREAYSAFAASLERFYEFSIRLILRELNIDPKIAEESWNKVTVQSERQLGAFIFIWLAFFKFPPITLKSDDFKTRNKVIHNGYIPKEDEAINFGNKIISCIAKNIIHIYGIDPEHYKCDFEFHQLARKHAEDSNITTIYIPTTLGRQNITTNGAQIRLETHLEGLRKKMR